MAEGEKTRLIAWSNELRAVHQRLRGALRVTRAAVDGADGGPAGRDLLLFCHGFCAALTGHHQGEDRELLPVIAAQHPELRETLRKLGQDHVLIAGLVDGQTGRRCPHACTVCGFEPTTEIADSHPAVQLTWDLVAGLIFV